ncbi:MAG TPA: hypothetical protein VFK23_07210 [Nitrospirota bacterium]|jgi:hypothetical protein|nr:hypothetical protein [Nitrospirota bacterium]HSB35052.1 hypothetical protein [Nitrospirota bacterium]
MDKDKIGDLFSKMSPASKKELLNDLVASLLKDVSPTDKKQVLQSILAGRQGSGQVIDMVER